MNAYRPAGLSRDRIADAAVKVAFEDGVWAVTMRRVGNALGVEAMSLYTHVDNKDDLLLAMVQKLYGSDAADRVAYGAGMSQQARDLMLARRYVLIASAVAE